MQLVTFTRLLKACCFMVLMLCTSTLLSGQAAGNALDFEVCTGNSSDYVDFMHNLAGTP